MTSVLVSGGGGYIGSVLTGRLLAAGYRVTVLDSLIYGQLSLLGYCSHPSFEFVRGDVRDEGLLQRHLQDKDVVIWLAAIVGAKACDLDPMRATSVNLEAVRTLNRLRSRQQRVLFPCTNSGYGTRTGDLHCTEETPLDPISLYGRTKVQAEAEFLSSPNAISLRLATVFGPSPRMRMDLLVNDFVHRAVTDGFLVIFEKDFVRNYVHVEDVADCMVHCLDHFDTMRGEAYNVGLSSANLSKEQLALTIKEQIPSLYIHYAKVGSDPDKRNYIVSNEKLRRHGYEARRSLSLGIEQLRMTYRMLARSAHTNA